MPAPSAVWNLVNTYLADGCVGATAGSVMQKAIVTAMCQKMEMRFMTPIQWMGAWGWGGGGG